jgi:hypothetical protein
MHFYLGECNYSEEEISVMLSVQTLIRCLAYLLLTLALTARSIFGLFAYDIEFVLALSIGVLILNLFFFYLARQRVSQSKHIQFIKALPIVDIIFASFTVHLSGGIESQVSFIYLLPCLALLPFSFRDVLKISGLSLIAYLSVIMADYYGFFPITERFSYTVGQLAFIDAIKLALLILITVLSVLLLLTHLMRTIHSQMERKNEIIFSITHELGTTLEEAHGFLYKFRASTNSFDRLYEESEILQNKISEGLRIKDQLLEKTEQAVPMSRLMAWRSGLVCQVCNKRIKFLGHYWAIPSGYSFAHNYGNYQNELHCESCHTSYGGQCMYCHIWNKA